MKCATCKENAELICPCQFIAFCLNHVGRHIIDTGHSCEPLNMTLDSSELNSLKEEIRSRITKLEESKEQIYSVSHQMIKQIKLSSKKALQTLEKYISLYLKFLCLEKISKSLKSELDKVASTAIKVNKVYIEIKNIVDEGFSKEIVTIVDKEEYQIYVDNNSKEVDKKELDQFEMLGKKEEKHQDSKEKINILDEDRDLAETSEEKLIVSEENRDLVKASEEKLNAFEEHRDLAKTSEEKSNGLKEDKDLVETEEEKFYILQEDRDLAET